jgi:hypothetical protein
MIHTDTWDRSDTDASPEQTTILCCAIHTQSFYSCLPAYSSLLNSCYMECYTPTCWMKAPYLCNRRPTKCCYPLAQCIYTFVTSFIDHKNLSPLRSVETPQETSTLDISRCRQSMSAFCAQFYMFHQVIQELCTELGMLVYGLCTYAATRRAAVWLLP